MLTSVMSLVIIWLSYQVYSLSKLVKEYEAMFDEATNQDEINQLHNNQSIDALLHEAENNSKE